MAKQVDEATARPFPTPWKATPTEGLIVADNNKIVATPPDFKSRFQPGHDWANEAVPLIVAAVNAHSALVAALEAVEWTGLHVDFPEGRTHAVCPSCIGFNPNHIESNEVDAQCEWPDDPHGHADDCALDAALRPWRERAG